jgi:hypothetical protein
MFSASSTINNLFIFSFRMKKVRLYIFSCLCLLVFICSESKSFMEWWADYRIQKLHAPFTRARYGDLYSGCFLPQFMDTARGKELTEYKTKQKNTDLYILHDSYLANQLKKENFIGVDTLITSDFRGEGVQFKLNKNKKNILIIECSERMIEWRTSDTASAFSKLYTEKPSSDSAEKTRKKNKSFVDYLFNPMIDRNIEFNLFDYEIFRPFKEIKAQINYNLFDKIPSNTAISSDKKYLFLNETVDPKSPISSFWLLLDPNVASIVNNMNTIYTHYKKLGFTVVYFSFIPNPVTILDRNRNRNSFYNYKIGRIKDSKILLAECIHVVTIFNDSKKQIYRRDDSHWNRNGIQLWVNEVNAKLIFN